MTEEIQPSLMTLLTDDTPGVAGESRVPGTRPADVLSSLTRDLESLLNSRMRGDEVRERRGKGAAPATILEFGLPDFGIAHVSKLEHAQELAESVRRIIAEFEPRLTRVRVEPVVSSGSDRRLKLRIRADLVIAPFEPVAFHSSVRPSTGVLYLEAVTA